MKTWKLLVLMFISKDEPLLAPWPVPGLRSHCVCQKELYHQDVYVSPGSGHQQH